MNRTELKKLHDTKCGQAGGTTHDSKWQYFTTMSFVNAVTIPRLTLSNVPATEESVLGVSRNLQHGNASTNISLYDNDSDEFIEGVPDERQVNKYLGTKRKINFQGEDLHLQKRKIKLMEETLMKKFQADQYGDYVFLMSLLPSIKKT
jgi:hypothetical protein